LKLFLLLLLPLLFSLLLLLCSLCLCLHGLLNTLDNLVFVVNI
jgi:hypothetical protein